MLSRVWTRAGAVRCRGTVRSEETRNGWLLGDRSRQTDEGEAPGSRDGDRTSAKILGSVRIARETDRSHERQTDFGEADVGRRTSRQLGLFRSIIRDKRLSRALALEWFIPCFY